MAIYKTPKEICIAERIKKRNLILSFGIGIVSFLIGGFIGGTLIYQQYKKFDDPNIRKLIATYELMLNEWYFGDDEDALAELLTKEAIDAMLASGNDPYTFYTATMEEQNLTLDAKGIGISYIYYGGYRYITDVFDEASATDVLSIGDILKEVNVNGEWIDLRNISEEQGNAYLRNKDEDCLVVKVQTEDGLNTYSLEKTNYTVTDVSLMEDYVDIHGNLYVSVKVRSFLSQKLRATLSRILSDVEKKYGQKIYQLAIDLRNNGGGYVNSAVDLCSMFVPANSAVVRQRYKDGSEYVYKTRNNPNFEDINSIAIIQNSRSASASESFAVAMKDLLPNKVHIVGATSYGKGIIQSFKTFSDGSVIRYTIAQAFSPNGYSIHQIGLSPDELYTLEYDYELLFARYQDIDVLSSYAKEEISSQISLLLIQDFASYFVAVSAFQDEYNLPITGEADRETRLVLQQALMDYYVDINYRTEGIVRGIQ